MSLKYLKNGRVQSTVPCTQNASSPVGRWRRCPARISEEPDPLLGSAGGGGGGRLPEHPLIDVVSYGAYGPPPSFLSDPDCPNWLPQICWCRAPSSTVDVITCSTDGGWP